MANYLTRRSIVAVVVTGVVLVVSGCGSSSSGPSKSAYVARADAICQAAQSQTGPLIAQITSSAGALVTGGASAARRVATTVQRLDEIATTDLKQLQALPQPSADHSAIERFLTPLATVVDSIGEAAKALHAGQAPAAFALLQHAQPVSEQVTNAAQAYGLRECESIISMLG